MLLQFDFENFRSFKEETSFDMTAAKVSEMPHHIVELGGEKILLESAIYGANGSGKSNVYEAFACMTDFVLNSCEYGKKHELYSKNLPKPFLFERNSSKGNTWFEVYFILPDDPYEKTYDYGFSLNPDGIVEEWLNVQARTARKQRVLFYRSSEEMDLSGIRVKNKDRLVSLLNKDTLMASLGAEMGIDLFCRIREWFENNRLIDFENREETDDLLHQLPDGFESDPDVRKHVVEYLHSFDHSIIGFQIEGEEVFCLHQMEDSEETASVPLKEESAGTLKMFAMYQSLVDVLEKGGVYFIDDLDSSLHPLMVRYFGVLFHKPETNPHHAQLIFTTHDVWQLSNLVLRRDEIWFASKNQKGESRLYSLADFVDAGGKHIRKDADYEKNYLYGRYGAIPDLDPMNLPVR